MKISLACNNPWGAGGQGNFLNRASQGLRELGELTVYCAGYGQPTADFPVHALGFSVWSQRILSTPIVRRRRDLATLLADIYFDRQVSKRIQSESCDLLIGVAGQSYLSFKAAKAKGTKVWMYCLNTYLPFMQAQIRQEVDLLKDAAVATMHPKMLDRFAKECALADFILVNSQVAKQTFIDAGFAAEKLAAIAPVVDTVRFHPTPKKDEDSVFRVLYVGTIDPRKGVHYLIPAFLKAQIPNSELLLVGGYSTRAMRILIEDTLSQHANIKQEIWDFKQKDPTEIFSRCSVLVMPSVEDGFGVVALEGMACGLPAIVTSYCGAADIIQEGVNGFVVPPRDVEAIAQKLGYLSEQESMRLEMGKAARNMAMQHTQVRYNQDIRQIFSNLGLIRGGMT
ncbi:Glycosyltransferase [Tumidithrix helvetica PCC 7403]|uniref:glycosyltransferase family 4 protein n=1 Tax=Tumidithrix helvetica TaxID=3457545 RepID=UPI003CB6BDB3